MNHRIFDISCLKNGIIPVYMILKSPISTNKANAAIIHASKVCIKENLRGIIRKLFTIRKDINKIKEKLRGAIEKEKYESIPEVAQKRKETTYQETIKKV
uniref:Uncharacterized protein n=1 Tax=Trichobilharzia regenti TaxID=157069 RepID=A0AA85J923_TRIRE|nr:unnamed protein product [Trichobilharzia regenti]